MSAQHKSASLAAHRRCVHAFCKHGASRRLAITRQAGPSTQSHRSIACCATLAKGDTVLVAGSTGGVGQIAVGKLLDAGFKVRALTRSTAKARELFADSVDIVEADPRDANALKAADVYGGCSGAIVAIGTTAFPSSRWEGDNGPEQTDLVSSGNLIRAAPRDLKHFAFCTSAGVERSGSFPFIILNLFGVLKYKKAAEDLLKASGLSYTIVRPSRLTDGPYTSYDLNTLMQATSGTRQKVILSRKDDLLGEASRIATAEALWQALVTEALQGETLALSSEEGAGPGSDSASWARLVQAL